MSDSVDPTLAPPPADMPPWLRIERSALRLNVFASQQLSLSSRPSSVLWLLGLVCGAGLICPLLIPFIVYYAARGEAPHVRPPTALTALWVTTVEWRFSRGWLRNRRLAASAIFGVEVSPVFPSSLADAPTYRLRAHYLGPRGTRHVITLLDGLPSEDLARWLAADLQRVYRAAPSRPTLPLVPFEPPRARLRTDSETVEAEWDWPPRRLSASSTGLRVKRLFVSELIIDADAIADLFVVPSRRRGHQDLVVRMRSGESSTLLGAGEPPGLAPRLLPDLRRVLKLDGGPTG